MREYHIYEYIMDDGKLLRVDLIATVVDVGHWITKVPKQPISANWQSNR